ncbi:phosphatidate cytidylyltransferase [uncultured Draconibacterium sp.]|uniref:phosphatidate cytidylyltransferase n=1 Tax=uncultured Draconibacterium sp. TaxID=1573823 RepID=UPI0029C0AC03|nr:phosphatidate cytidylyltransferase [uncultured Draconibacterium sp.]
MSNLLKRSLTGIIYIAVMLGGTLLHPIVFAVVFATLLFITQYEFYAMVEKAGHHPSRIIGSIFGVIFFLVCFGLSNNYLPRQFGFSFIPIVVILLIVEIFRSDKDTLKNAGSSTLGFAYIALPFSLMNFVVHTSVNGQNTFYPWIMVGVFFILWINDSAAYLVGTQFGKHKMCKNISPAKSWEGLIGGAVFAVIMGLVNAVLFQAVSMVSWIAIAVLTVVFGTLGDLFESKIKREIDIKDSGTFLPGHGGFLDRLDSLLFVIPAIFIWLIFTGNV